MYVCSGVIAQLRRYARRDTWRDERIDVLSANDMGESVGFFELPPMLAAAIA